MRQVMIAAVALLAVSAFSSVKAHAQALPAPAPTPPVAAAPHTYAPWWAFTCPASVLLSAAVAAGRDGRELTYWEAYTCGALYWVGEPPRQYVRRIR